MGEDINHKGLQIIYQWSIAGMRNSDMNFYRISWLRAINEGTKQ